MSDSEIIIRDYRRKDHEQVKTHLNRFFFGEWWEFYKESFNGGSCSGIFLRLCLWLSVTGFYRSLWTLLVFSCCFEGFLVTLMRVFVASFYE